MKLLLAPALVGAILFPASTFAAPPARPVSGAVESLDPNSVTIDTRDGGSARVMLIGATKFVYIVRSSMSKLHRGDYVGVATKQQSGRRVALEISIFPKSMTGMDEGRYLWRRLRDTTRTGSAAGSSVTDRMVSKRSESGGTLMRQSAMINATVSKASASRGSLAAPSAMTNGTVSHMWGSDSMAQSAMTHGTVTSAGKGMGGRHITVSYKGKRQQQIWVPASAVVVRLQPASRSALEQGARVFIIAAQNHHWLTANFVAVSKNGLTPPM